MPNSNRARCVSREPKLGSFVRLRMSLIRTLDSMPFPPSVLLAVTVRREYALGRRENLNVATRGSGAEGQVVDYYYYIVEHSWLVRVNAKNMVEAERFAEDGQWVPFHDLYDITMNGRQITAEKATEWIRESGTA